MICEAIIRTLVEFGRYGGVREHGMTPFWAVSPEPDPWMQQCISLRELLLPAVISLRRRNWETLVSFTPVECRPQFLDGGACLKIC